MLYMFFWIPFSLLILCLLFWFPRTDLTVSPTPAAFIESESILFCIIDLFKQSGLVLFLLDWILFETLCWFEWVCMSILSSLWLTSGLDLRLSWSIRIVCTGMWVVSLLVIIFKIWSRFSLLDGFSYGVSWYHLRHRLSSWRLINWNGSIS